MVSSNSLFCLIVLVALFNGCISWGPQGHRITAAIAQKLLTPKANRLVAQYLKEYNGSMEDASTWADNIKKINYLPWSYQLHYANTPDWECTYDERTHFGANDVVHAIRNYSTRLVSAQNYADGNMAAKFLIHFMGDLHQPLHVGFASDQGGNLVKGTFFGEATELHAIWDFNIIQQIVAQDYNNDTVAFHTYLSQLLNTQFTIERDVWMAPAQFLNMPIVAFASETARTACEYAYLDADGNVIPQNFQLHQDYFIATKKTVEFQLLKGGSRLAGLLNFLAESQLSEK